MWEPLNQEITNIWLNDGSEPMSPVLTSALHALPRFRFWNCEELHGRFPYETLKGKRQVLYYSDSTGYHCIDQFDGGIWAVSLYGCSFSSPVTVLFKE